MSLEIFSSLLTFRFFLQYHAPEEYNGYGILDHGVDAYSYGNNIYILVSVAIDFSRNKGVTSHTRCYQTQLTGLWPFYDTIEEWKVRVSQNIVFRLLPYCLIPNERTLLLLWACTGNARRRQETLY